MFIVINQHFFQAMEKVFENMFFMCPERVTEFDDNWLELYKYKYFYYIELNFDVDFSGKALFYFPFKMSAEMLYNAIGLPSPEHLKNTDEWIEDNLRECLNMIAGNFFSTYYPEQDWGINFALSQKEIFQYENKIAQEKRWQIVKIEEQYFFYQINLKKWNP